MSAAEYVSGHAAFEGSSSQQEQILDWLVQDLREATSDPLTIASIGPGSGILDVPMLAALQEGRRIEYLGIEPFAEPCEALIKRAGDALNGTKTSVEVEQSTLEAYSGSTHFDRVQAIHSAYYFTDLAESIGQLRDLVAPAGTLTIAMAPREAMNLLADVFWTPTDAERIWFLEDVLSALEAAGMTSRIERLDAHLTIDLDAPSAGDILSFLIQSPYRELAPNEQAIVLAYLGRVGERREQRLTVPHPVAMITSWDT